MKFIKIAILTMVVFYLLLSFITMDLNCSNWNQSLRIFYAMFLPIFTIVVYSIVNLEGE